MRESVTADDLAIESAKEKLAALVERDDFKAAMTRDRQRDPGPKIAVIVLCLASAAGAITLGWLGSGLLWIVTILLGVFAGMMALAWFGFTQEKASTPFGVAVVGKLVDKKNITKLQLLRADGEQITAIVADTIYDLVKPGDIGVAWLRKDTRFYVVTDLERL